MRNMSFTKTVEGIRSGRKTVTRRLGWRFLKPGDELWAVEKAQGLKKGEKIRRLRKIRVLSTRLELLSAITPQDVIHEDFSNLTPAEFVDMFCRFNRCTPETEVNRIEFEYLIDHIEQEKQIASDCIDILATLLGQQLDTPVNFQDDGQSFILFNSQDKDTGVIKPYMRIDVSVRILT